jgi:Domain of unknown function (DUF5668)
MTRANRSALFWGTVLVLLGLLFLLNNFNLVPTNILPWWPVLVLGAGVLLLGRGMVERGGAGLIAGTILVALGGFWLLDNLGRMDERLFVPVLLIALGLGLLLRSLVFGRR